MSFLRQVWSSDIRGFLVILEHFIFMKYHKQNLKLFIRCLNYFYPKRAFLLFRRY